MPTFKEATFFSIKDANPGCFAENMRMAFEDAPPDALLGKVTPEYMIGGPGVQVELVVERIRSTLPEAKLIALLRDPIERAVSSYTMAVRRGWEQRSVDDALSELLDPEELVDARLRRKPAQSHIVAGEYGRVLEAYRAAFPAGQLLTVYTEELARDPGALLDSVLDFLGLPAGFRPEDLETRHFRGGARKLLDPESERLLRKFHKEEVLPHMRGSPLVHKAMFDFFYQTWNVAPDNQPPRVSGAVRAKLEKHFKEDSARLTELGIRAPWIVRWDSRGSS